MWLLKFKTHEGSFLLHDGESFVGGETEEIAGLAALRHSAKSVSVGGFEYIEVTVEQLAEMIGTTVEKPEFNILAVHGGLIPFSAVKIVKEV